MDLPKRRPALSGRRGLRFYSYVSLVFSIPFFLYIKSIIIIIFKARSSIDLPYQVFCIIKYFFDTCLLLFVINSQSVSSLIMITYFLFQLLLPIPNGFEMVSRMF